MGRLFDFYSEHLGRLYGDCRRYKSELWEVDPELAQPEVDGSRSLKSKVGNSFGRHGDHREAIIDRPSDDYREIIGRL